MSKCWGKPTSGDHYPQVRIDGKQVLRHRIVYEVLVGPIPSGHELDHTCAHRWCYCPWHLEPVMPAENKRRAGERTRQRNRMRHLQAFWDNDYQYVDRANYTYLRRKAA